MKAILAWTMGLAMLLPALALPATATNDDEEQWERFLQERRAELHAQWDGPSALDATEARSLLAGTMTGNRPNEAHVLELLKWLRDATDEDRRAAAYASMYTLWRAATVSIGAEALKDRSGLAALTPTLLALGPKEGPRALARLGLDSDGLDRHAGALASMVPGLATRDVQALAAGLRQGTIAQPDVWQQDAWDAYGLVLTAVWLVLGGAASEFIGIDLPVGIAEFLPHNLRIIDFFLEIRIDFGCSGDIWRGEITCILRGIADILALAALDWHYNTDTAALQFPLGIEIVLKCKWFVCSITLVNLDIDIARNAAWVFAIPSSAGQLATRATAMDVLQSAWDRLGFMNYQRPRESTSAPVLAKTPLFSLAPMVPGLGDLATVAPPPNYFGLQVSPRLPATPAPPTLPGPAADGLHKRVRNDFTSPGDSTGFTVGFEVDQIRTFRLNLAFVRFQNTGSGTGTNLPEPPASFYYDAGSYFSGRSGNVFTADYSVREGLPLP